MQAEIVMIGTELLLGQIEDTNSTHISRVLALNNIPLYQKTTVGDNPERICEALDRALSRSDVVLCSGGLGPTEDDITRECVAEVLGRPLEYHEEIYEQIEAMFARYRLHVTENNKKQAMVPRGGAIIANPNGTAPGLLVEDDRGMIVCMPGVPRELIAMLDDSVIPHLRDHFDLKGLIHYRVLKVCGVGESVVDNAIGDLMSRQGNPTVGVLANIASVRIRIAARADSLEEADALIDGVDREVRERLPGLVLGVDDDTLEGVVDELLAERGWTLAVVETTSGGMIAQRLTAQGARQFAGGRVFPTEGLDLEDPRKTALELARSHMVDSAADCGLAMVSDPVGGVSCAVFVTPEGVADWNFGRAGRDERTQARMSVMALEYIRRHLSGVHVK